MFFNEIIELLYEFWKEVDDLYIFRIFVIKVKYMIKCV